MNDTRWLPGPEYTDDKNNWHKYALATFFLGICFILFCLFFLSFFLSSSCFVLFHFISFYFILLFF